MSSIHFSTDKIDNYKTLVVYGNFPNNSNIFTFDFNNLIEFVPDELCLNSVSFYDKSGTALNTSPICLLYSDIVNNYILCHLPNLEGIGNLTKLDSYFKITQPIQGTKTFTLKSITNDNPSTSMNTFDYNVALTITFYKYKSMK